jgi:iron complex outermembrane receptor protein
MGSTAHRAFCSTVSRLGLVALAAISADPLLAQSGAATSQTTTAPPASDQPAVSADQMAEITVTARKVGENIVNVPISITALSSKDLNDRGVVNLEGLNDFSPGLHYQNTSINRNDRGFVTTVIRGINPSSDMPNRQAVTIFVDGTPVPGGAIAGMSDVEHVEVVNGPQSAYFGRSTFAGAINFITRTPGFTFGGDGYVDYSSYGTIDVSAGFEGPLIADKLAVRISGRHYSTDGDYQNVGYTGRLGARETNSASITMLLKPIEDLSIRGYFTLWEDKDGPPAQSVYGGTGNFNCAANRNAPNTLNYYCGGIGTSNPATLSQNVAFNARQNGIGDNDPVLPDYQSGIGLTRHAYQAHVTFDYHLGDFTISGTGAHNQNNFALITDTYNLPPQTNGFYSTVYVPYRQKNNFGELRVSSPQNKPLRFLVGASYFTEDIIFDQHLTTPAFDFFISPKTLFTSKTKGIYGSATWDIVHNLTLSGEARYQWDDIGQTGFTATGVSPSQTFKSFNPRVILSYHPSHDVEVYASYAKGTRPGSFNAALYSLPTAALNQVLANYTVPLAVPEEKITMYEGGVKGEFFDHRLRLLTAVYYGEWRGRQTTQSFYYFPSPTSTVQTATTGNIGGSSVNLWGVEAQATVRVTKEFTLDGSFDYAATDILVTNCVDCSTFLAPGTSLKGNTIPRYPVFSGSASATYRRPVFDDWTGFLRADYIYTGKQYDTEANLAWTKPNNRVNLRVGIEKKRLSIQLYGENVFNSKVPTNVIRFGSPLDNSSRLVVAAPLKASAGVRVSVKY